MPVEVEIDKLLYITIQKFKEMENKTIVKELERNNMEWNELQKRIKNAQSDSEYNRIIRQYGVEKSGNRSYVVEKRDVFIPGERYEEDGVHIGPTKNEIQELLKQCERKFGVYNGN